MTSVLSVNSPASIGVARGRLPLLGHGWSLLFHPLEFLRAQRDLGDIVEFRPGPKRAYLVNNPELVHQMLTRRSDFVREGPMFQQIRVLEGISIGNADGDVHHRQRRLVQPLFHASRFPGYAAVMKDVAVAAAGSWHDGQAVAVDRDMYRVSATIMAKCLYSGRLADEAVEEIIRSLP